MRRQALLIMIKQATALTILAPIYILQTAEVAVAICQEEQTVVEKMMIIKNDFCKQIVSPNSRFPRTRNWLEIIYLKNDSN